MISQDRFGFRFWLLWILGFSASWVVSAVFWSALIQRGFGKIEGKELSFTWAVCVFGSWFLMVVPFMRKKEQIWKRLNVDEEKAVSSWLHAMGFFIGSLIAACLFWSLRYKSEILQNPSHFHAGWAKAVLVSWLLLLLPFLIFLYRKADQIFKAALNRQRQTGPLFRTSFVERNQRLLPRKIADKLQGLPPTLERGHLATVILKDGRRIPNVFILNASEILGVYDRLDLGFEASEVEDLEVTQAGEWPAFEESRWLRVDGRA